MLRAIFFSLFYVALAAAQRKEQAPVSDQIVCSPEDLYVPDPYQCDKFYECADGNPQEKLCPDGLVFDNNLRRRVEKCDYPFNVDCGNRLELQPPTSQSIECPRLNGIFAHEDPTVCDVFYLCVDGVHQTYRCDGELHFNEYTGVCEWPNVAGREGCRTRNNILPDGFQCPENVTTELNGITIPHPLFPHPDDCQKFYVCLNGKIPRENACPDESVFNDIAMKCDNPSNVPGCENWFGNPEEEPLPKPKGKQQRRRR